MRRPPRPARRDAAGRAAVALLALLVAGCTGSPEGVEEADDDGLVMVVVGDSITAGDEALAGREIRGSGSWVPAATGDPLTFGGGWAVPGATTADMRSGVRVVDGDVLVLMGGTNDVAEGTEWPAIRDNLLTVTRALRIDDVLLSAVPPFDPDPEAAAEFNGRLRELATEQGWSSIDPWTDARLGPGWVEGASADGIHPSQEVADDAGRRIRAAVLESTGA